MNLEGWNFVFILGEKILADSFKNIIFSDESTFTINGRIIDIGLKITPLRNKFYGILKYATVI